MGLSSSNAVFRMEQPSSHWPRRRIVKILHRHKAGCIASPHLCNYRDFIATHREIIRLKAYANTNKEVRRMMWCRTSKGMIRGC